MEWLILCLLVPAIVVPLVLLWGFAGCTFDPQTKAGAPVGLGATPKIDAIKLDWQPAGMNGGPFAIHRAKLPQSLELLGTATEPTFEDPTDVVPPAPLERGVTYRYQVFDTGGDVDSDGSDTVDARPLAFAANVTDDQPLEGFCLITRIPAAQLKNSGEQVKIRVRGAASGNLTINRVFISQPAAVGDAWDSLPVGSPGGVGLTKVVDIDLGDPPVTLLPPNAAEPNRNAKTLGPVVYTIPAAPRDLLIAFDISAAPGQGNVRSVAIAGLGFVHYFLAATQQAKEADRFPNAANPGLTFQTGLNRHYLVEAIEVLGLGE
jgi:hypothetical protein